MPAPRRFTNWLGNVAFTPRAYHQPENEAEVAALVMAARRSGQRLRVIGAGHSWSAVCATDGYLLNLDRMQRVLHIDPARQRVTVQAGIRLHALCAQLDMHGLALVNLGSIKTQSLAGAISTGTHGTGLQFGSLATQVIGLRLVTGTGEIRELSSEHDPELLAAARVSLGALGVITQVTLQVTAAFSLREQRTPVAFADAAALIPGRLGEADHLKLWWFPHADRVQVYRQSRTQEAWYTRRNFLAEDTWSAQQIFRGLLALGSGFPQLIPAIHRFTSAVQFTPSVRVGPSHHVFGLAMPPRHHESEYAVPLHHAAAAMHALRELILTRQHRVHFILEFRFVKQDHDWLSPAYGHDVCFIGAYDANRHGWPRFLRDYEELMHTYGGRPHWGKEFTGDAATLRPLYPRWDDFLRLRYTLDPDGVFLNPLLQRVFAV